MNDIYIYIFIYPISPPICVYIKYENFVNKLNFLSFFHRDCKKILGKVTKHFLSKWQKS